MAIAKAWGLLPSQWMELSRADRALITAHEANEVRCSGCGTPIGLDPSEIEAIEQHEMSCTVCQATHAIRKRDRRKLPEWVYRGITPRFKRN